MPKKKRKNPHIYLAPALMGILSLGLIINLVVPDFAYSQTENRPLASFPQPGLSSILNGSWQSDVNTWYADQFAGRNLYFHLNYIVRKLTGQREISDVFLGRRALLAQNEKPKEDTIKGNVKSINDFAQASGLPVSVMVVPSAASIQTQKLPLFAPVNNASLTLDSIYSRLDEKITGIDLRETLKNKSKEYIYYKTDHHWTSLGAGIAFDQLCQRESQAFTLKDYEKMPVSTSFKGTLASKTGSVFLKDEIDLYAAKDNPKYVVTWSDGSKTASIYDTAALKQKDQYEVFLSSNQPLIQIQTDNNTSRHLLLIKDSYANSMVQFMLPYYQSITIVDPRYFYEDLDLVMNLNAVNEVLFVFSYNTFVTDSSMQEILNSYVSSKQQEDE